MRIVGVVGDVKQGALNTETVPHAYTPWLQVSDAMMADNIVAMMRSLRIAVRGEVEPEALAETVRARVRAIDAALPVASVQTMNEIVSRSVAVPRFNALLVSLFAALALLLAAIGVGGMLATSISRRLPELGIRMALGAQRPTLVAMVVRHGMILRASSSRSVHAIRSPSRPSPPCCRSWRSSPVRSRPGGSPVSIRSRCYGRNRPDRRASKQGRRPRAQGTRGEEPATRPGRR
jgi:hypothetical protein